MIAANGMLAQETGLDQIATLNRRSLRAMAELNLEIAANLQAKAHEFLRDQRVVFVRLRVGDCSVHVARDPQEKNMAKANQKPKKKTAPKAPKTAGKPMKKGKC